jgi:hypothetical protein
LTARRCAVTRLSLRGHAPFFTALTFGSLRPATLVATKNRARTSGPHSADL